MGSTVSTVKVGAAAELSPARTRQGQAKSAASGANRAGEATPRLEQRRGEVLRGFFPKLASWFENAAERAHRNEVEEYLSQAVDIVDLEDRIRRLERRSSASLFH